MRTDRTPMRHAIAVVVAALALAACGADSADTPDPDGQEGTDQASVAVAETSLGEVLVDADGMTLYVFEPDDRGPSTCVDTCAANWPPSTVGDEPVAGGGVDTSLLGTVERDDGTLQVTYDGWPLYGWIADDAPGDVTGQGVENVWWVITADGTVGTDLAPGSDDGAEEDAGSPTY